MAACRRRKKPQQLKSVIASVNRSDCCLYVSVLPDDVFDMGRAVAGGVLDAPSLPRGRPEVMDKLFNPFFTTKSAGEGTGLGLSISHDIIVKQHGGFIEVDTNSGEFTEFRIVLPRRVGLNCHVQAW